MPLRGLNTMAATRSENRITELFRISVLLKGANALLEIVGGIFAILIPPSVVTALASYLTQGELRENPHDFVASHLLQLAQHFSVGTKLFVGLYLLSHGIVKFALAVSLLKNQLWAYPMSLVVFGLFVFYQVYLFALNHSLLLVGLTIFDLIVMWLIWREYKIVLAHLVRT